ncbi:tyrosine-protein phosphatase [Priestia flexa]|uniref:tyrosine-protein phosphatase n=1 Tax=Priestia flexa TaxID=86664 RepID=UPI0039B58E67
MIDLHCHILPGIDDGSVHEEMSVEMAKRAVSQGIKKIVATPHHQNGRYFNTKQTIEQAVNTLNKRLQVENIPLTILPGQEIRIYGEILQDYHKGEILTLNNTGKYIFVEFPSSQVPRYAERLLYDIQSEGLIPIIVHPERNSRLIEEPKLLYEFVKKGALAQLTASSITGQFGKKIKNFSNQLLEANLIHFIASDSHDLKHRNFNMEQAVSLVQKEYGLDTVYMFLDNAEHVINGQACFKEPPEHVRRKKFLGLF